MIFLSAQPDEDYFIWQLELQLYNFRKLKIAPEHVQVLIGFDENRGLNSKFADFIKGDDKVQFFIYPDTRELKFYPSSLRPHIIKKHISANPLLEREVIFYHDSDIIFRELPNFDQMIDDDIWYLSNAKSYLDSTYLKSKGESLFENMCSIVNISPNMVVANDNNVGGAQYLLKNTTYEFWDKVEQDCVKLYFIPNVYEKLNDKIIGLNPKDSVPIQAWCSDMWALLWNSWRFGYKTQIHDDLDFCWPHEDISRWYKTKIYHDAGVLEDQADKYFCKSLFKNKSPFFEDFSKVISHSCSYKYVEHMRLFIKKRAGRS